MVRKSTGIIRGLDTQRRVVVPKEALGAVGLRGGDMVEIFSDVTPDGSPCLMIQKYKPGCYLCGWKPTAEQEISEGPGVYFRAGNKKVCLECMEELQDHYGWYLESMRKVTPELQGGGSDD